jgi:DNA-binding CsgD family transcriptional regulator/pimeloyl-ACP methyl ester carboxylesterase
MDAPPVQYAKTRDGFDIAYSVCGEGYPFVMMPLHFSHIQLYWTQETFMLPWLQGLAERFQFIQYDGRGQGMSTRGLPEEISATVVEQDLEAVTDHLRLGRFILLATGWQDATAVGYAVAHPERIAALILMSPQSAAAQRSRGAFDLLAAEDWELFLRSVISANLSPARLREAVDRVNQTWTQRDYLIVRKSRIQAGFEGFEAALARIRTPTLVLHPQNYVLSSRPKDSMQLTAQIANARFVMIEGETILGEPAQGLKAISDFVGSLQPQDEASWDSRASPGALSAREREVLRLVASGRSNAQIAADLVISQNTVIRHVSNIFAKTGAANRAEATAYAARHGLL